MKTKSVQIYPNNTFIIAANSYSKYNALSIQPKDTCDFSLKTNKNKRLSFKGLNNVLDSNLEIKVLEGVKPEFVKKVEVMIQNFPKKLLKELKDANFKVIISKTLTDAYNSEHITDFRVFKNEFLNPKGSFAATYYQGYKKNNFFVFADKPSLQDMYLPGIVNHELCHGIESSRNLCRNNDILKAIKSDTKQIIEQKKLNNLSFIDRQIILKYFYSKDAESPLSEMISDALAWKIPGGGCYGSGMIANESNENLIPGLFQNLSKKLDDIL